MTEPSAQSGPRLTPWLVVSILAPFALGYFLSYLYRSVNAVTAPDLVRDISLSASELGFLTAAYLLAFAAFQLPLGVLLDRFGPRRTQAVLMALTGVGALIFAAAGGLWGLSTGRALIGIGCAGGLMAGFQAVALWLPEARRALANSIIMAVGGAGIFAATMPADFVIQAVGWRGLFLGLMVLSFAVAALIWFAVPERGIRPVGESWRSQVEVVARIYSDPVFWRVAPLVALTAGSHVAIQTLWAGPWLSDVAGFGRDAVAANLAAMAIGFIVGTLFMGAIADWLGRRGVGLLDVMLGFIAAFMMVQLAIVLNLTSAASLIWLLFGMVGQSGILAYPWLSRYFGVGIAGRANTALNFVTFITASAVQYLIGAIIDLWPATEAGGYPPQAYQVSLGIFLGLQALALVWYVLRPPRKGEKAAIAEKGKTA
ncbi:MAG: MFS transporter [Hyphomicrobiales bacterium]